MASNPKIIVRPTTRSEHTTSSLDTATRSLLEQRLLVLFGIGFLTSLAKYCNDVYVSHNKEIIVESAFSSYYDILYLSHPLSFLLGFVIIYFLRGSGRRLLWAAFIVMALNLVSVNFSFAAFRPNVGPLFPAAMMLFAYAAIIPAPFRFQVGLVVLTVVTYPLFQLLALGGSPAIQAFWENTGGAQQFQRHMFSAGFDLTILGAISAFVNMTLYNMRQKVLKAKQLGNYFIKEELGQGGMGRVYVAEHAMIKRPTALKVVEISGDNAYEALARFEREVKLTAMLTHPNTITIFDFGRSDDNTFYYAMEFLEGMDLQKLIEKFGPMPAERVIYILKQVCGSLAEAHARDIIHRDLKPSNIFLTRRGGLHDFVKVLDFGLAKQLHTDDQSGITRTSSFLGTPRYVAPESVYGSAQVDCRADLYNLGAVAYWMLTGQPIFAKSSDVELIVDQVKTVPPRPSEISELEIPLELDAFVMKCLQKAPADRYQNASDALCALSWIETATTWGLSEACDWWNLHFNFNDEIHICPCSGRVVTPQEAKEQTFAPPQGQIGQKELVESL